jgi:hypothetical protein
MSFQITTWTLDGEANRVVRWQHYRKICYYIHNHPTLESFEIRKQFFREKSMLIHDLLAANNF